MTAFAPILQAFFTDRLIGQRQASPHTIAAYRDTFRLLLALRRRPAPHTKPSGWTSPTWTRRSSPRSSTIWKPSGTTASAPATPGLPRSTRCSATPRCATPNTPH